MFVTLLYPFRSMLPQKVAALDQIKILCPQHNNRGKTMPAMVKKTKKMMRMKKLVSSEKSSPVDAREACQKLDGRSEWLPINSLSFCMICLYIRLEKKGRTWARLQEEIFR